MINLTPDMVSKADQIETRISFLLAIVKWISNRTDIIPSIRVSWHHYEAVAKVIVLPVHVFRLSVERILKINICNG